MIISPARRYIFVHIPKTGGTALTLALEARAHADDILIGDTPKAQRRRARLRDLRPAGRLWKHSTLADIDGVVTPAQLDRFFLVTLVRNPWDRLLSYWQWLQAQGFDHPAVTLAKATTFSAFLNHPQTRGSVAGWPYAAYLRDAAGVERAAHYVRLERLEEDIATFEAHLGFRLTPLARANESDRPRDWRGAYSDADAALVAELCRADILRFGYSFDGLS